MRREWEPEELIACWTLVEADQELVANKSGATRLGFALLLKFFELEARFPRDVGELPPAAVNYVAEQVRVDAAELDAYGWSGRAIEYHRAQIRQAYGFRETTRSDETDLELLQPLARLRRPPPTRTTPSASQLFSGYSEKLASSWRARAATQYPSDLRAASPAVRFTLLASLCSVRTAEITDSLVDLLIALSHKINARAESRVEGELTKDLKRVAGKQAILFRVAEASLADRDGTVRRVVFPAAGRGDAARPGPRGQGQRGGSQCRRSARWPRRGPRRAEDGDRAALGHPRFAGRLEGRRPPHGPDRSVRDRRVA